MKKNIIYFILIAFTFFISCKKDEPSSIKDDCIEIPDSQSPFGYDYEYDINYLGAPCFNPNNGNEILFVKTSYSLPYTNTLYKYNLQTKNKELLLTNVIYSQPCWARNDWILLGFGDSDIWKIKSNGDSLTQLTFDGGYYHPKSNYDANVFICKHTDNQCSYLFDFYGNIIDTIQVQTRNSFDWNKEDNILILGYENVQIYNYSTQNIINYPIKTFGECRWINKEEFIWYDNEGVLSEHRIFKTNIINNETVCLKSVCNAWFYNCPNYSEQLDKFIWQKKVKKKIGDNLIEKKSKLVLMDTNCSNEEEIVIKW